MWLAFFMLFVSSWLAVGDTVNGHKTCNNIWYNFKKTQVSLVLVDENRRGKFYRLKKNHLNQYKSSDELIVLNIVRRSLRESELEQRRERRS